MKDFDKILNEQLDGLPVTGEAHSKMALAQELARELESARERVAELERDLRNAVEDYNVELAKALRRRLPQLGINLSDGRCSASYRSTNLSCRPDLDNKSWVFDPNPHGRRFSRKYGTTLGLADSLDPLADAIVQYFSRYKTLR
jgi:hypothetical protein